MKASEPTRKPVFRDDITHLGVWYWYEIEGRYEEWCETGRTKWEEN